MIQVSCRFCPDSFSSSRLRDALEERRFHEEQWHREAPVETDTSSNNK